MDLGAIFLLLVVILIVALFVTEPFTRRFHLKKQGSQETSTLLAERERALDALVELDFDNRIGKVPSEEYSLQRANLVQKGAEIFHRLDEIEAVKPAPIEIKVEPVPDEQNASKLSDDDLEELLAKRRLLRQQKTAGFCHTCGKPILESDHFCPSCGQMIDRK